MPVPEHEPSPQVHAGELAWAVRANQRAADELNQALARAMGMHLTDLYALDFLVEGGPKGPVDLGRQLGMTSASSTALVDRLERAGHVRRVPHPSDRRRLTVEVTDHARAQLWQHIQPIVTGLDAIAGRLEPDERAVVLDYLRAVEDELLRHARSPATDAASDDPHLS